MPNYPERDNHSRHRQSDDHDSFRSRRGGVEREAPGRVRHERFTDREPRRSLSPPHRHDQTSKHRHRSPSPRERRDDRTSRTRELDRRRPEPSSPPRHVRSRPRSRSPPPPQQAVSIHTEQEVADEPTPEQAELPNFAPSGKLAAETKTVNGVVLKYHEPPEARKPNKNWRLYVFKGKEQLDVLHVHRQSAYLIGRDRLVVDIPIDHPSSSKQHAVLQFRQIQNRNEFGDIKSSVKPFLIDLESANGTIINGEKIPEARYYELQSGDVIKFGLSTREFVLIPET